MGARGSPMGGDHCESAQLALMTCGLSTQQSPAGLSPARRQDVAVTVSRTTTTAIVVKLPNPTQEFLLIEPKVLSELQVRHRVRAGALVEPALLDPDERGRLLDREPSHALVRHDGVGGGSFG